MRTKGANGRIQQAYLLFGTRVVCQATRLAWAPLLIPMSEEMGFGHSKQGQILSAFSFGYLFTQILGGMAADRYGGKPVQTLSLVASALGMLLIPVIVHKGYFALCLVYFLMGLCQGPQHPGYNAMAAVWFGAAERGWVSSVCEAGPVCGTLLALLISPRVAAVYGWRTAFTIFGLIATAWTIVWQYYAYSSPSEMSGNGKIGDDDESAPEKGSGMGEADSEGGLQMLASISNSMMSKKRVARATKFPFKFFTYTPVWAVIGQHMIFNTTRYFFADWTPIIYQELFNKNPVDSGFLLTMPFVTGAIVQILMSKVEGPLIKKGFTPLQVRKMLGSLGFLSTACCLMMMPMATGPWTFAFILSIQCSSLSCHACGYKANYMDLTSRYQGQFMGTGNTIASICTFSMPLVVAALLGEHGKNWNFIFVLLSFLNLVGIYVNQTFTVVKELHVDEH